MPDNKVFDTVSVKPQDGNKVPARLPIAIDASGKTTYGGAYNDQTLVTVTEPGTAGLLPQPTEDKK